MSTTFVKLVGLFNDENNEEAGEHWTSRGAWLRPTSVMIGYEISFNRHGYKPTPLWALVDIQNDIRTYASKTQVQINQLFEAMNKLEIT